MTIIKRLKPYLKPYRSTIILTLILGVLLSGVNLGTAKLVQIIFDDIFTAKNVKMLYLAPLIIIGLYGVGGTIRFFYMFLLRYTGNEVVFDLRNDLQKRYNNLSLEFHGTNTPGALISHTMNDVNLIQQGLTILADAVKEPINAVGLLGYLVYANWRLTLISILATPILILASRSLGRSVRKYSLVWQQAMEALTSTLKETLDGIKVIKAFNLEKHMQARFKKTSDHVLSLLKVIFIREELAGPVFEFLAAITFAAVLFFAGWQIIKGQSTTGQFMSFVYALMALQAPIKKLQDAHVRLQHTVAACERVFAIIDRTSVVVDLGDIDGKAVSFPSTWDDIEFKNVRFSYGDKEILKGIDLNIKRGEMVAIVGSSGAGKSTLVNLLPRFYDVTTGSIKVGDVDIRDMSLFNLRSNIGLVTQDVFLFNESVKANVLAGQKEDDNRVEKALQAAYASEFVEDLPEKVETTVGDRGTRLSGGERQRISIARALFKNAPILILDEATSSLDSESEKIVQKALDDLMVGRTTLVIAHRLSTIKRADRIIVVSDGRVVEQGTHDELLGIPGTYQKLYSIQFQGTET